MLEVLNRTTNETELPLDTISKRDRVEQELRIDSARSDREIGRICGVDGKTVALARKRHETSQNVTKRNDVTRSFEAKPGSHAASMLCLDPKPSREDLLKAAAPHIDWEGLAMQESLAKVAAIAKAEDAREALGMNDEDEDEDGTYWPIPSQARIECRKAENGDVHVWQEGQHGPSEDVIVHVAAGNAVTLARHILYAAGFPSIGIYMLVKGGGCVDIEDGDIAAAVKRETSKPGYGPVR